MNKKPIELHVIDGTKPNRNKPEKGSPTLLPASIKKRVPKAEWLDNPYAWDKEKFITETADFLWEVYGIGAEQDKHALSMLADQIDVYVKCSEGLLNTGVVTKFNGGKTIGPSPYLSARNKSIAIIIQLMNELGLTPRSRLSSGGGDDDDPASKFMRGPKG